jgi:hypothetical protein
MAVIVFCTMLHSLLHSQALSVQVMIQPPYSNRLEDYLDKGNNVLITVVNTSPVVQQFKLIPSIEGNNGVFAGVLESFLPTTPISMIPGESRVFTFSLLKSINANLKQSDLRLSGISYNVLERAGVLPEGTYTLCVRAIQYGGTAQLSGSGGCATFFITAYDPPMLLMPQNGADVLMPMPQLINFQWTPSGISGKTRYRIKLIDMSAVNAFNPNDAFNNPGVVPYFEQANLPTSIFTYDQSKPALIPGRSYAVQVTAYDPEGKLSYKNQGRSQAHLFTLRELGLADGAAPGRGDKEKVIDVAGGFPLANPGGKGGGGNPPVDPNDAPDCMLAGACQLPTPGCEGAKAPAKGAKVTLGKFTLEVLEITGGNGSGAVEIPFLQTRVEVQFQNIMVNGNQEVCSAGAIWASSASAQMIPDAMLKEFQGVYSDASLDWPQIQQHIQQQSKRVSLFQVNQAPKSLPFTLDLGAGELTILGLIFTPAGAFANVALVAPIPLSQQGQFLSLGMKGLCIRPNGMGIGDAEAQLTLGTPLNLPVGPHATLTLAAGIDGTTARFDCRGITSMRWKGSLEWQRDRLLPLDAQGKIVPAPALFKATFDAEVEGLKDAILEAVPSHPAFTSAQANGFSLGFEKLILDFSAHKNPSDENLPENHPLASDPLISSWTGLVLQKPTLSLPNYLRRKDNQAITLSIGDVVVDEQGLWVGIEVENVIDKLENGSFGGWGFALDKVSLDIRQSQLHGGGLEGAVNLPITEVGIGFNATYEPGTEQQPLTIQFGISLGDKLDIDMFFAQASLHESSTLSVLVEGGKVKPSAMLHGSLTIGWDQKSEKKPSDDKNDVSSFSLPSLNFQGLNVFNDVADLPALSLQAMELANLNSQGKLGGFPIKLSGNPGFSNKDGEVGLSLGLLFTLSKENPNGLKGNADFTIYARYNPQLRRFAYDRTEIQCISLENLDIAVASLSGSLCLFKNDPEFGDGFSGSIEAKIKGINVSVTAALGVGSVQQFDYFYFEAMVQFPGIPVSTSMSLYGFGGGFYYNMTRDALTPRQQDQYQSASIPDRPGPGYSPSGQSYSPKKGEIGFNATVVFGLSGGVQSAAAFNGDLTFWMVINDKHGITSMGMDGGGYLVQPLNDRQSQSAVSGTFNIKMDFVNKSFDLGVKLKVNLANGIVDGSGDIVMHASPQEWFVYLGQWDTQADAQEYEPWNDGERISVKAGLGPVNASFNLYFMMGSITPELPPLPGILMKNLLMQDGSSYQDPRKANSPFNEKSPGFAFGAGFRRQIDIDALIFYARVEFFAGFDLMLTNYGANEGCENIGINGWFAKGQAYAYLDLEAGLKLDLWIYKGEFKLVDIQVAAMLYAEFPNPNYLSANVRLQASVLNGLIKVDKQVRFEVGKKMSCGGSAAPFSDMPIVAEISPSDGDEANVYDDIRVAYNFPKDVFKVFNELDPASKPRFFYYKVQKIELAKGNVKIPLSENPLYTKDGYTAKYLTKNNMFWPEKSQLTFTLVVRGYESLPGNDKMLVEEPPYVVKFNTKALPDKIPASQMLSTSPLVRQRYYLQGDHYQGHVRTLPGKDFCYLFNKNNIGDPAMFDQSKTEYLVQFTELGSGKITELPCQCSMAEVTFSMPPQLKGKTMYRVRVLARLYAKSKPVSQNGVKMDLAAAEGGTGSKEVEITQGAYKISRYLLPPDAPKGMDHVLNEWFFQTSMYSTFSDKIADYSVQGSTTVKAFTPNLTPAMVKNGDSYALAPGSCDACILARYDLPVALLTGKEAFDQYDLYGYTVQYGGDSHSQLPVFGPMTTDYVTTWHHDFYTRLGDYLKQVFGIFPAYAQHYAWQQGRDYQQALFRDAGVNAGIRSVSPYNGMTGNASDALWSYYSKYKHMVSPISLPNGMSVWEPEGPLSQKEIDEAMAATKWDKQVGIGPMQLKISPPPAGMGAQQQGLKLKSNHTPVYPLINLADLLALYDYHHAVTTGWYVMSPMNKGYVYSLQTQVLPALFRDKGDYYLKLGNLNAHSKQFKYNWSKSKPK